MRCGAARDGKSARARWEVNASGLPERTSSRAEIAHAVFDLAPVAVDLRPARNQVVTVPGNIWPRRAADRSSSTERATTDCWHKREYAIARSFRKRCLPGARRQALLSARRPNQRERASKLTPLRCLLCGSRACLCMLEGF